MIELVISGGQSGADQAGWRAAKKFGIPTGGWMPKGFRTLEGDRPEFAELYGAKEVESRDWAPRTRLNAKWADVTLIFTVEPYSGGTKLAIRACDEGFPKRPWKPIVMARGMWLDPDRPKRLAAWLDLNEFDTVNIAGNREVDDPRITPWVGDWVEAYLTEAFRLLDRPIGAPLFTTAASPPSAPRAG